MTLCLNLNTPSFLQVFLTLCTLVTLYFAKEVSLGVIEPHHLSDSAPLLTDQHSNDLPHSKVKSDMLAMGDANGKNDTNGYEKDANLTHVNGKNEEDHDNGFSDSPGAVLVNLLTSLRHLPPSMHSVLIVMALSWVSDLSPFL